ncbi:DUF4007 family protein [butyrate-producing bacterium]|jgi:hypothetical protein|nr:DUF4007 family protein [butyrate-producing bacterium]
MIKRKYRLKGHESFILRDGWLTKGIQAVEKDNGVFSKNSGADALGVGTNMAKAIRYWMRTAGVTRDVPQKGVQLTEIGKTIAKYDPYIEDPFTLWILHCKIAGNFEQATAWNVFFNKMDLTSAFTRDDMFKMEQELILEETGEEEVSERSLRDDCTAILSMYSEKGDQGDDPEDKRISPFEELGLISRVAKGKYVKTRPIMNKLDPLVILFLIMEELNANGSMQIDYTTDGYNMPGKLLNLNRIIVNDFLDTLQMKKFIIVNRTAGLDIIYPDQSKELTPVDLLTMHYERDITS